MLLQRVVPRDVSAVVYHAISDAPLPHVTPLYACKSTALFERDLIYLKQNFDLVSHDEIVAHRFEDRPLPPRAATVSFDDGFAECHDVARPLLLKHGVPCTFFIITGLVGTDGLMYRNRLALCLDRLAHMDARRREDARERVNAGLGEASPTVDVLLARLRRLAYADRDRIDEVCRILEIDVAAWSREHRPYMTWAQLAQLHSDGFVLGGHTIDHPRLGGLDSAPSRREQIVGSCRWVAELTGRDRVPFAFPFNGVDVDRDELAAVREESGGIDLIYDTNDLMKDRDFIVNRIWGDTPVGGDALKSNLPGLLRRAHLFEPVRGMKRRLRSLRN